MNQKNIEHRLVGVEMRAADDEALRVSGLAIVYESQTDTGWGFDEVVARGAAKDALATNDQYLLWQHDTAEPLARVKNGTLTLRETDAGVEIEATLPKTQRGRDIYENIRSGLVDKMSFGFIVESDQWSKVDGGDVRRITKVGSLLEVSMVTFPAYQDTDVQAREAASIATRNKPAEAPRMYKVTDADRARLSIQKNCSKGGHHEQNTRTAQ